MAVTLKNAGWCRSINSTPPFAGAKVTLSFCARVDGWPSSGSTQTLFQFGNTGVRATGQKTAASFLAVGAFGSGQYATAGPLVGAQTGVPYHVVVVFDKDDPARQFLAVNGFKQAWPSQTLAMQTPAPVGLGASSNSDITLQDVVAIYGYAATDDDVAALVGDPAAAAGFAAEVAASVPAAKVLYYSLAGPVGTAAATGDPGLSGAADGAYDLEVVTPTSGDVVAYVEPMVYEAQCRVRTAYVGSSGKSLTVVLGGDRTDREFGAWSAALNASPTIRIDGGAPISFGLSAQDGTYLDADVDGVFLPLPAGVVVSPGQQVVLDAPADWFPAAFGRCESDSGVAVANYAGMPVSDGLWPGVKPMRLGANDVRTSTYYSATFSVKNLGQLFGQTAGDRWPDGTIHNNGSGILALLSGTSCPLDTVGTSAVEGRWVACWDDYDHANPVTVNFANSTTFDWIPLPAYSNPGDSEGKGKVRVWELRLGRPWSFVTSAAVAESDATIPFVGAASWIYYADTSYLTLGDEQILIGGYDKTAKAFTGCTRGWNGTTAAAHPSGTPGVAKYTARSANVTLNITAPVQADAHYRNLGIYAPGSVAIPDEPGPLQAPPRGREADMELDPTLESYIEDGVGAWRYMQETPVVESQSDLDWPEQLARPGDQHLGVPHYSERYVVSSIEPVDFAATPYFFSASPWRGAETYPVTLGAAIATAPAPGTVEAVTIANGRAAPILMGQPLFAGSEVMVVKGLAPAGSDVYQVARGALGTTPAPHAAGAISAGYRVPFAGRTALKGSDGKPVHGCVAVFDDSASTPLSFGRILSEVWTGVTPDNLTVRRTFALAAALDDSTATVPLTATDPADWDVVAKGARLTVEGEALTVTAVDAVAGTVTVAARTVGAAAHASGTAATLSASGALLTTEDGTRRAYNGLVNRDSRILPIGQWRALILAADETGGYLNSAAVPALVQTFSGAASVPLAYPKMSRPYEATAYQTGRSPGAWHWLNVPHRATEETVYAIAKAVRDNLPPGRKVVFELCNEVWNWGYVSTRTGYWLATLTSGASGASNDAILEGYVKRSALAFETVKACFAEVGRGDEVLHAACWQPTADVPAACRRVGADLDAWGCSPYFNPPTTQRYADVFNALDDDRVCDLQTFLHLRWTGGPRRAGAFSRAATDAHERATGKRLKTFLYEGGLETVVRNGTAGNPDPERRRTRDIVHNPFFYFTERTHYAAIQQFFAADLFMHFVWSQSIHRTPITLNYYWALLWGPAQKPGYGDGRNGGVRNKDYTYAGVMDLAKGGGDAWRESVRAQAWFDHQAAWREADAESVAAPDVRGTVVTIPAGPYSED